MKIKIQEALEAKQSCENLLKKSFQAKVSFKLLQLKKELEGIVESFEQIKNETISKYAEKDEQGEPIVQFLENGESFISVAAEHRITCTKELTEALQQEVEIKDFCFSIEEFGDETITGEDLIGIFSFINEE